MWDLWISEQGREAFLQMWPFGLRWNRSTVWQIVLGKINFPVHEWWKWVKSQHDPASVSGIFLLCSTVQGLHDERKTMSCPDCTECQWKVCLDFMVWQQWLISLEWMSSRTKKCSSIFVTVIYHCLILAAVWWKITCVLLWKCQWFWATQCTNPALEGCF